MNLPNSWKNYFSSLSSADERNRRLTDVRDLLRHGKSPDQAVTDMVNDPDSVILYRAPDDNMKTLFQHNQFTGSWLDADRSSIFVSHSGAGAQAGVYEVDRSTLFQDVTLNAPTATSLRNTNSSEALLALQAPAQNPTVFHGKRSIVLPPFLVEAYYGADDRSPAGLFEAFQRAIVDFDNANAGASASADCAYVQQFLWACAHSFIEPVTREDSERPAAVQWSEGLHGRLIASTTPVLPVDGDVARGLLEAQQHSFLN